MDNAFPAASARLAEAVQEAAIDFASLEQRVLPCQLSTCLGTCCHDGVYLSSEEADVIRDLGARHSEAFAGMGADLPERPVVYGKFRDITSGPKTATRPEPMHDKVADYPEHFADTGCVFLLGDARCALQLLAEQQGLDAWHFKPLTCWIHPLSLTRTDGQTVLKLPNRDTDSHRFSDYPGFASVTHCGRECSAPAAKPAWQVFENELRTLGEIGRRDVWSEICQHFKNDDRES